MKNVIVMLTIFCIIIIGSIALQVYLSQKEGKLIGMILPFLTFGFSLLFGLNMIMTNILSFITTIIVLNVPTMIYLAIFSHYRGIRIKKRRLDKMNIHDL